MKRMKPILSTKLDLDTLGCREKVDSDFTIYLLNYIYNMTLAEQSERKAIRKRQLEVDRVELKRQIQEAVEQFDDKLLELYKMRLAIEKCILAEELKILLYDRRMSVQDHIDREEERLT